MSKKPSKSTSDSTTKQAAWPDRAKAIPRKLEDSVAKRMASVIRNRLRRVKGARPRPVDLPIPLALYGQFDKWLRMAAAGGKEMEEVVNWACDRLEDADHAQVGRKCREGGEKGAECKHGPREHRADRDATIVQCWCEERDKRPMAKAATIDTLIAKKHGLSARTVRRIRTGRARQQ